MAEREKDKRKWSFDRVSHGDECNGNICEIYKGMREEKEGGRREGRSGESRSAMREGEMLCLEGN